MQQVLNFSQVTLFRESTDLNFNLLSKMWLVLIFNEFFGDVHGELFAEFDLTFEDEVKRVTRMALLEDEVVLVKSSEGEVVEGLRKF